LVGVVAFPLITTLSAPLASEWTAASEALLRVFTETAEPEVSTVPRTSETSAKPPSCGIDPVLSSLETRDPIEDARASISHGNFVLLGVYTSTSEVPGVSGDLECWERELGILWIPDTSDAIRCEEHGRLQEVARAFAERYNRFLLGEYLRTTLPRCPA
jgi:hypothetical protein